MKKEKMSARQHLLAETEFVKSTMKLTLEERRMEVRRQLYYKLKAMEMAHTERITLENM